MLARWKAAGGLALLLALIGLAVIVLPAVADPNDGQLGGPHEPFLGVADSTTCPDGAVVTGVHGDTAPLPTEVVDLTTVDCLGPGGVVLATGTIGAATGDETAESTTCAPGEVAVGIGGREGNFIDQIELRCRAASHTGPITASTGEFGTVGGGTPDGPYDCPDGRALTGLVGESISGNTTRFVEIICEPAPPTITDPPATTAQPPPPAPKPVLGKQLVVQKVKGTVLVAVPAGATVARVRASQKGLKFVPIEQVRSIPVGSFLDTSRGTVRLTAARDATGKTQAGNFDGGVFQVLQSRRKSEKGLTDLVLKGGSFKNCTTAKKSDAVAAKRKRRRVRKLRANARGRFRTRGRYSAATVRGTTWTVTDRCDGTLTKVARGSVVVRDLRRKRNVIVRAGKRTKGKGGGRGSYLARAG